MSFDYRLGPELAPEGSARSHGVCPGDARTLFTTRIKVCVYSGTPYPVRYHRTHFWDTLLRTNVHENCYPEFLSFPVPTHFLPPPPPPVSFCPCPDLRTPFVSLLPLGRPLPQRSLRIAPSVSSVPLSVTVSSDRN